MMLCRIQDIKEIVEMLCLKLLALRKVLRDHNKNFGQKTTKFCYEWQESRDRYRLGQSQLQNISPQGSYVKLRKERQSSEKLKEKSDKTKKFLFKQLRACDLLSPLVDGQLKAMIGEMRFELKSRTESGPQKTVERSEI